MEIVADSDEGTKRSMASPEPIGRKAPSVARHTQVCARTGRGDTGGDRAKELLNMRTRSDAIIVINIVRDSSRANRRPPSKQ